MFRSLHMKLVLILVLLIVSVMAVVGIFLINSVGMFYLEDFREQVQDTLWTYDMKVAMENAAAEPDGAEALKNMVSAYSIQLGLDQYRSFGILNARGEYVTGSGTTAASAEQFYRRPNVISAMRGQPSCAGSVIDSYMDYAIPVEVNGEVKYIVYINDDKQEISELSGRYFAPSIAQSVVTNASIVPMLGWIMPEPLQMPPMRQILPPAVNSTATVFISVSVVMMAVAAASEPSSDRVSFPIFSSMHSMFSRWPITPVDATTMSLSARPSSFAAAAASRWAFSMPSGAHALALPEFTTTACAVWSARCSIVTCRHDAFTRLVV